MFGLGTASEIGVFFDTASILKSMERRDNRTSVQSYLSKLDCWDFTIPKEFMVRKAIYSSDEIDDMEREYKRYMALSMVYKKIPMPPKLDDFWHSHVIFTRDYAAMCQSVCGHFVHHNPAIIDEMALGGNGPDDTCDSTDEQDGASFKAKDTLALYRAEFGEPDLRIWNLQCWKDCCSSDSCA